jgi:site-specific DNA-methyltransferase (adenine-specific)
MLINGDCVEELKKLDENSVDLTVTSPPYDDLRTYNDSLIWNENIWQTIIQELYRVTKEGGVVVWVVGDATNNFSESLTSFKQVLYFKEIGFNVLDTMIYYKQNYAPAYPTLRRYANQFEYMFVFSKGKPKTFNPILVKKVENRDGLSRFRKKDGTVVRKRVKTTGDKKKASNVWSYPVGFKNLGHPAVFPEKLAEDHILSWSNKGDTVLDPLMGSGTTGKMAIINDRKFIGIEKEKEYFEIAKARIEHWSKKEKQEGLF